MKTVYIALSLTHVKTEAEKNQVRLFLKWIEATFNVKILVWAFNVDTWTPQPVSDIYEYDTVRVVGADLVIFLYLTNDGSDGRGGEVVNRVNTGKSSLAFAAKGVKVSRYASDCLKKIGVEIQTFEQFEDMRPSINAALAELRCDTVGQELLFPEAPTEKEASQTVFL